MKFAIRNVRASDPNLPPALFDSLEDARAALREMLGWPDVLLGPGYTAPNTQGQIWCAYRTRAEAEADPDGLSTPRIVRVDHGEVGPGEVGPGEVGPGEVEHGDSDDGTK